jgi:hypothetical protein
MLYVIFMDFNLYVVNLLHFQQSYQKYSIYFYHLIYSNFIYLYLYLIKYDDIYDNK